MAIRVLGHDSDRSSQKPMPLWALVAGMAGFWSFFSSLIYPTCVFGVYANASEVFSTAVSVALIVAGVILGALEARGRLNDVLSARLILLLGCAAAALFCFTAVLSKNGLASQVLVLQLVFAILLGSFVAALGIGWARICAGFMRRNENSSFLMALSLLVCTVVMVGFSIIFPWSSTNQFAPVYVLLVVSSILCFRGLRGIGLGGRTDACDESVPSCRLRSLIMLVTLGVYLVGSGMLRGVYTVDDSPSGITGSLIHAALLIVLLVGAMAYSIVWEHHGKRSCFPWIAFILLCVVALYIAVLFSGTFDYISNELILPTRPLAMLFLWCGALAYINETGQAPGFVTGCIVLPIFAFGRIAVYATWFLLRGNPAPSQFNAVVLGVAFLLTVGVVAYLALPGNGIGGNASDPLSSSEVGNSTNLGHSHPDALSSSIAGLSERYGLSERESQVLALLVEGNSRAKIAELLVLSVNSVQTYAKTLYRKMGVHSRQELVDLVRRQ